MGGKYQIILISPDGEFSYTWDDYKDCFYFYDHSVILKFLNIEVCFIDQKWSNEYAIGIIINP